MIEVDVAGVRVTIENGASPATIAAVIGALKPKPLLMEERAESERLRGKHPARAAAD